MGRGRDLEQGVKPTLCKALLPTTDGNVKNSFQERAAFHQDRPFLPDHETSFNKYLKIKVKQSICSGHNSIILEIDNNKIPKKSPILEIKQHALSNSHFKEEITGKLEKYFYLNDDKILIHQNCWVQLTQCLEGNLQL